LLNGSTTLAAFHIFDLFHQLRFLLSHIVGSEDRRVFHIL
jgi:hypothetical protein